MNNKPVKILDLNGFRVYYKYEKNRLRIIEIRTYW